MPQKRESPKCHSPQPQSTQTPRGRPDLYAFAPTDVLPDALILQCTTVAGDVEGDAPSVRVAYVDDDQATLHRRRPRHRRSRTVPGRSPGAHRQDHPARPAVRVSSTASRPTPDQLSAVGEPRPLTRRGDLAFAAEAAPVPPGRRTRSPDWSTSPTIVPGAHQVRRFTRRSSSTSSPPCRSNLVHADAHPRSTRTAGPSFRKLKAAARRTTTSLVGRRHHRRRHRCCCRLPVLVNRAVPDYTGIVVDRSAVVSAVGSVMIATTEQPVLHAADRVGSARHLAHRTRRRAGPTASAHSTIAAARQPRSGTLSLSRTGHWRYRKRRAHLRKREDTCWVCGQWIDPDLVFPHPMLSWSADHVRADQERRLTTTASYAPRICSTTSSATAR